MIESVERWLPVVGWEGLYEVSSHGRVRSVERTFLRADGRLCTWKGRILRQSYMGNGYAKVTMSRESRMQTRSIHGLVLEAFVSPRPEGMEACHGDGNPKNNRIENLRWDTKQSNTEDKRRHGTILNGSRCGSAVLDEEKAALIRKRFRGRGGSRRGSAIELAREFGVTPTTILALVDRRTWRHV